MLQDPISTSSFPVTRVDDVPFAQVLNEKGEPETLHLDIYLPEDSSDTLRPAVIWFHGGGFTYGNDKRQVYIPRFASAFAERGYVGICPDYRVRADPFVDFPSTVNDAVADARAALAWVHANGAAYRIDPRRIALAGGSAGGMTVLYLMHNTDHPVNGLREGIFAVIDLWGTPGGVYGKLLKVNPACPPTLIVHGTADEMVAYQNSANLAAELEQVGVFCKLLTLPGAKHTPLAHFDQIVEAAEEFLAGALKKQASEAGASLS